ncbi:MAG: hypothetical protein Q7S40_15185 [Opitutaceae bacterium]|nr:hypothetical protein [Opitutaceae bacterium]
MKQERGAGRRQWFEADGLELVVWLDRGHAHRVSGFQLCYDLGQAEYALTWREGSGFAHSVVDTGDATPLKNQTPILTPENDVPWGEIARRFDEHAGTLEDWLRQLVHDKLAERAGASAER